MRKTIASVHRWSGLLIGLYVALTALSGVGMIFQSQFWEWEMGKDITYVPEQDAPWVPFETIMENAEARYGPIDSLGRFEGIWGRGATPLRIDTPVMIYEAELSNGHHGHGVITFNPYNGEPLGKFVTEEGLSYLPLFLHLHLVFGEELSAAIVLPIISIAIILFVLSGLYMWWPGSSKRVKAALKPAAPRTPLALRKLHSSLGAWAAVLLVISSLTGLFTMFPDWAAPGLDALGRVERPEYKNVGPSCGGTSRQQAWNIALERLPGHTIGQFISPIADGDPYFVQMRRSGNATPTRGSAEVWIDATCPKIIHQQDAATNQAGDVLQFHFLDIHSGKILGLAGEAIAFFTGLFLAALPIMGIWLWMWKRQVLKRKASLAEPHAAPGKTAAKPANQMP